MEAITKIYKFCSDCRRHIFVAIVFLFHALSQRLPSGEGWVWGQDVQSLSQDIRLEMEEGRVGIFCGGEPFAFYQTKSTPRPILWPIHGPDGVKLTRSWPIANDESESKRDHPHHRSLWFSHGEVNGIDFWSEGTGRGNIQHQTFSVLQSEGERATLVSQNHWLDAEGHVVLLESRRMRFYGTLDRRWIDFDFAFKAPGHDVHFGDTKEGSFGLRVAEWMAVETKRGGRIINSEGQTDDQAWGQPADWVDYQAPRGDTTYGIAVLIHPSSHAAPGRWHVRGYGLFAHNPFGVKDFVGDGDHPSAGGYLLQSGEQLRLSYRVVFHRGDELSAAIREIYTSYAESSVDFDTSARDR